MKKQILLAAAILFSAGTIFLTGCKKDDTSGPDITLNGSATEMSILNVAYVDPGATAEDAEDGVVTVTSDAATVVNKDLAGIYKVTYTATDAAGNETTSTRDVTVYNEAAAHFAATYNTTWPTETDASGPYTYGSAQTPVNSKPFIVTASTTQNNRVIMNRLGDFDNNTVYMDVTGTSINIPSQVHTSVGIGAASCLIHDRQTAGTGAKTANGFTLSYNDSKVAPCSGTRPSVTATFIK